MARRSSWSDSKNADLLELDGAEERLSLCRADVLNAGSLRAAFSGCHGVFHVASPVSNDHKAYDEVHSGRAMFDKEIAVEEDIFILEEIGKLAMECLKEKVEERPDMKEVAERLVMLRRARKHGQGSYNLSPRHHEEISIETTPTRFGADFSTNSSVSLSATCTPELKELYKL
ncbi:hypothetical protein OsI_32765 [Oryza sativa Indica Group]|uniref:3-beta hydroxysteroid dehydrogenase/isomerase domain-containing protein n=1 Tax=Oryza sativa subsp. indica TaxID=39946 RepID=A2Z540_ORYSI|nr:hypothetical protein OsI_32765 [Oryza sativa Indica Group]